MNYPKNNQQVKMIEAILKKNGFKIKEKASRVLAWKERDGIYSRMQINPYKGLVYSNGVRVTIDKFIHGYLKCFERS